MAGHGPHLLHEDPALEKYNQLHSNLHRSYKLTKRAGFYGALFLLVIPGAGMYIAYKTEGKMGFVFPGSSRTKPVYNLNWEPRR